MLKRISKLQKPILENDEEFQRVELLSASRLLKDMMMATIKAANKLGALDKSVYEYDEEAGAEVVSKSFFRAMERETEKDAGEISHYITAGMQSSAVNYAGLVLLGKMDPIYDCSIDTEESRAHTRESVDSVINQAGLDLAMIGALTETEDGRMVISENHRLFDTIKGDYYGKGSTKQKVKRSVASSEQHSEHKTK